MKHKCDGCEHKALHQEGNFRPFGVCLKEPDLIRGEESFLMKVCPHKEEGEKAMTENKLTEAEIMKALECCEAYNYDACSECPFNRNADCAFAVATNCLDLINRKNAENERLAKEVDRLSQVVLYHDGQVAEARAEAIKEFAERVNEKRFFSPFFGDIIRDDDIDQIAKEMGVE